MIYAIDKFNKLRRHYRLPPAERLSHQALNELDKSAKICTQLGVTRLGLTSRWASATPVGARLRMHEEFVSAGIAPPNEEG
jgi:hypothetical protein